MVREYLTVFVSHPSTLLSIPRGKESVMKKHASIEVRRAEILYEHFADASLTELFTKFDENLCVDYKTSFLYAVVRRTRPLLVVETGVASGISSYSILQALRDNGGGLLYSIDMPNFTIHLPKGQRTGFLVPDDLRHKWTLILGDSKQELPKLLAGLGGVDLFVHDSLHEYGHMMFEYREAWQKLRRGGILFSDDVSSSAAFRDFCGENGLQGTVMTRQERDYTVDVGWVTKP